MPSYFKNCFGRKIAYTEDDVVVRKLFLKCEAEVEIEELRKHFAGYGTIKDLQLKEKPADYNKITGYVLFERCHDAADALAKDFHFVNKCYIIVKAYYSWGQPDIEEIEPTDYSITRLNDDCLERIYRCLPLADQLNLARICKRCSPLYRSIDFDIFISMNARDVRDFFIYFGHHLREIVGDLPDKEELIAHYLGKNCKDLKVLRISKSSLLPHNVNKLFQEQLLQLEELQLYSINLMDESLLALSQLRNLRKLDLRYNHWLTGKHMDCLPSSIESLNILYCNDWRSEHLPGICKSLPNLRELSFQLIHSFEADADVLRQLVGDSCCQCLESLTILTNSLRCSPPTMKYLAMLPSLSKLKLDRPPSDSLLELLIKHKRQQLVHLEIEIPLASDLLVGICQLTALRVLSLPLNKMVDDTFMEPLGNLQHLEYIKLKYCYNVSEYAVLRLLLDCGKLHTLRLSHCRLLGNRLVHNIIKQLTEEVLLLEQTQRQLPVKLQVYGSKIDDLQHPHVARKDMVDVTILK